MFQPGRQYQGERSATRPPTDGNLGRCPRRPLLCRCTARTPGARLPIAATAVPIVRPPVVSRSSPCHPSSSSLAVIAGSWGVLMSLSPLLQIRAMVRRRSSAGVSVGYLSVLAVGFTLWLAYGLSLGNAASDHHEHRFARGRHRHHRRGPPSSADRLTIVVPSSGRRFRDGRGQSCLVAACACGLQPHEAHQVFGPMHSCHGSEPYSAHTARAMASCQ